MIAVAISWSGVSCAGLFDKDKDDDRNSVRESAMAENVEDSAKETKNGEDIDVEELTRHVCGGLIKGTEESLFGEGDQIFFEDCAMYNFVAFSGYSLFYLTCDLAWVTDFDQPCRFYIRGLLFNMMSALNSGSVLNHRLWLVADKNNPDLIRKHSWVLKARTDDHHDSPWDTYFPARSSAIVAINNFLQEKDMGQLDSAGIVLTADVDEDTLDATQQARGSHLTLAELLWAVETFERDEVGGGENRALGATLSPDAKNIINGWADILGKSDTVLEVWRDFQVFHRQACQNVVAPNYHALFPDEPLSVQEFCEKDVVKLFQEAIDQ